MRNIKIVLSGLFALVMMIAVFGTKPVMAAPFHATSVGMAASSSVGATRLASPPPPPSSSQRRHPSLLKLGVRQHAHKNRVPSPVMEVRRGFFVCKSSKNSYEPKAGTSQDNLPLDSYGARHVGLSCFKPIEDVAETGRFQGTKEWVAP